jgi:hypothetical protein
MKQRGFSRTITSSDSKKYRLPTGTYVVENTDATLQKAYDAAHEAATETGRTFWVIVVDWTVGRFSLEQLK